MNAFGQMKRLDLKPCTHVSHCTPLGEGEVVCEARELLLLEQTTNRSKCLTSTNNIQQLIPRRNVRRAYNPSPIPSTCSKPCLVFPRCAKFTIHPRPTSPFQNHVCVPLPDFCALRRVRLPPSSKFSYQIWDLSRGLNLLGTPASVGVTHVRGRLDRGDEFEDTVAYTDNADNGAGNDAPPCGANCHGSDEDIDCES